MIDPINEAKSRHIKQTRETFLHCIPITAIKQIVSPLTVVLFENGHAKQQAEKSELPMHGDGIYFFAEVK